MCSHNNDIFLSVGSPKPWDFYTQYDLKDTKVWRKRLAVIYRTGLNACPNFKLNIMNEHDRCGNVAGVDYYCSGYDVTTKYHNDDGTCTDQENCGTAQKEIYCVPSDNIEDSNNNTCEQK